MFLNCLDVSILVVLTKFVFLEQFGLEVKILKCIQIRLQGGYVSSRNHGDSWG